jgi:uncharacterized Zn finger protein (UPF0148 family)
MDGAIQRFDCAPCNTVWFRQGGTTTACPRCGAELTAIAETFVGLEVDGSAESRGDAPSATAGDGPA